MTLTSVSINSIAARLSGSVSRCNAGFKSLRSRLGLNKILEKSLVSFGLFAAFFHALFGIDSFLKTLSLGTAASKTDIGSWDAPLNGFFAFCSDEISTSISNSFSTILGLIFSPVARVPSGFWSLFLLGLTRPKGVFLNRLQILFFERQILICVPNFCVIFLHRRSVMMNKTSLDC